MTKCLKIQTFKIHFKFKIKNLKLLSIPEPPTGFEPITYCLQNSSSTVELGWLIRQFIHYKLNLRKRQANYLKAYFKRPSNFLIRVLAL